MARFNLEGDEIKPLTICLISGGCFIGSHLCEKILADTFHKVIVVDVYTDKIIHLFNRSSPWLDRIVFHNVDNNAESSRLEPFMQKSDIIINLTSINHPADYNTRTMDTIYCNFIDAVPVVRYCTRKKKRLIQFSSCEVYGKTIGSFLTEDHPLREDPKFYVLKEDESPCILGPTEKKRWANACAKQLIERLIYGREVNCSIYVFLLFVLFVTLSLTLHLSSNAAESAKFGLEFTIVRPFNWIGPRIDYIPGIDGERRGVPRVFACFSSNLLRGESLELVEGGHSKRTFCYIKDAIEALLLMIENPEKANGHSFNVGNPNNEVSMKELANLMIEVYANVSGQPASNFSTVDVSSEDFYGIGYDDCDRRIPDMTLIHRQLGWIPMTSLQEILEVTLRYQHETYSEAVKHATSES
ncbi:UDP-D-apiose/UDP-D-xylose synthase 2 isoform X1 [Hevea brasiliensis]|nr:UDP-D-apiose/UDP-D-xylose synthase 2 isoform X1 [Hevea brasiliensis]